MMNNKIRIYVHQVWNGTRTLTLELYKKMFVHLVPMCPKIPPRVVPTFQSWRSRQMQSWEKCSDASKFDCSWRDKRSKCICNIKIMYFIVRSKEDRDTYWSIGHICLNISLLTGDTFETQKITTLSPSYQKAYFPNFFLFWEVLNWPLETWLSKFFFKVL